MGIGDWGFGVGGWGMGVGGLAPTPKPQTPNPQSPIPNPHIIDNCLKKRKYLLILKKFYKLSIYIYLYIVLISSHFIFISYGIFLKC